MVIVVCIVIVAVLAVAAVVIGIDGDGGGNGGGVSDKNGSDYFLIRVEESVIFVDDTSVSAMEAARKAKEDGRPIRVQWDKAFTDVEDELKNALASHGLYIAHDEGLDMK